MTGGRWLLAKVHVQLSIPPDIVALELLATHKLASQLLTQGYSKLLAPELIHMLTMIPLVLPLALAAATSSLSVLTISLCLVSCSVSVTYQYQYQYQIKYIVVVLLVFVLSLSVTFLATSILITCRLLSISSFSYYYMADSI